MSTVFRTIRAGQAVVALMMCMTAYGDAVTSAPDYGSGLGIWNADPAVNNLGASLSGDARNALSGEADASEYGYPYGGAAGTLDRGASYANVLGYEPAPVPQYGQKSGVESSAAMAYPGSGLREVAMFPNRPAAFPGDVSDLLEYPSHSASLSLGAAAGALTSPSEAQAKADPDYANPVFPSASDPGRADSPVTIVPEPTTLALVGIALAGWISSRLRHRLIRT